MFRSPFIIVLMAALALMLSAVPSNAYMFGSPTSRSRYSTRVAPGISYRVVPRQQPSRAPIPRQSAAMAAVPAAPRKNAAERMFDFWCGMVFLARPDLFLYDRLARLAWDNIAKTLKQLEDDKLPENVLNKALKEMQNDLAKIQNAYADVADTQRRMYSQKVQAEAAADEWYRRAKFALSRGQEQISKEALFRRQELLDGAKKLQEDIEAQDETREKLYAAFQALESAFREKVVKRDDLLERAKIAKRMTDINEMLNEFNSKRLSDDAFDTLEQKVETLEAAAEASSPFSWFEGDRVLSEDERLEMEFAKLEASAAGKEVNKSKTSRMGGSSSSPRVQEEWLDELLGSRRY